MAGGAVTSEIPPAAEIATTLVAVKVCPPIVALAVIVSLRPKQAAPGVYVARTSPVEVNAVVPDTPVPERTDGLLVKSRQVELKYTVVGCV